ncbi:beta-hydroxyacyl-ACP dehydratase [Helicobacter saguini]|uniref:Beta-hydroxyacyl-ACP dehydratase n=1 Tax=Helicobacter saguini TaxID=1548018 RepID=A0A4U8T478_9HELI|nr:beta-hydroxyacyl-ACP dehydratase [Helicobacter saguini]MWV66847.1 beta-hydroxyacyl-ACP dehydratase [Helicobacter saguini]TLD94233.1 beta-hydroxyacyl-ACP dehydratase [Helicobacter saguini]
MILQNLNANDIQKYQQNRHPCFFVDYIKEVVVGKSAIGYKSFSYNEWFFPSHFSDEASVPGFIQMESLAQVFLMTFLTIKGNEGQKTAFIKSNVEFKKKIVPGNILEINAKLDSYNRGIAKGSAIAYLRGVNIVDVIESKLDSITTNGGGGAS